MPHRFTQTLRMMGTNYPFWRFHPVPSANNRGLLLAMIVTTETFQDWEVHCQDNQGCNPLCDDANGHSTQQRSTYHASRG